MRGLKVTRISARLRFFILIIIDSLIVTFSVFLGYSILEPFFNAYSIDLLFLSSVVLLISHHIFAYVFNLYHRAWEYASVSELMSVVKAVTSSILTTLIIVSLITRESPFLRLYFITWMMHLILIGGSRLFWRVYRRYFIDNAIEKKSTLVVGAGQGGSMLIRQMLRSHDMRMQPVLAVDDDKNKQK
ncbi:polysaccharide biosynthesis protein CapD [Staphylococcus saprophyticus subsp. saprophyticus KACC 16562]|nr:polysaccharide biosynthesis protein CapD [Staphylococcus saprophyticus subsp. saprophyticus KACC 16562]